MKETENLLTKEQATELYQLWKGDILAFAEDILGSFLTHQTPEFHGEIYKLLKTEKRLIIAAPRGFAKAQSLDSKVLTPDGWKKIGELRVDDYIYGSSGLTKIEGMTPVEEMDLYEVQTRDGRKTLCNLDHLWETTCPSNTGNRRIIKTTRDILKNYKADRLDKRTGEKEIEYRYFLHWAMPVEFKRKSLPIDPYTFGCWLGDGDSNGNGYTTADKEILGYFPYKTSKHKAKYRYTIKGIRPVLRKMGILFNKHIPQEYLFSSIKQRVRLLQGLIDTDGSIVKGGRNFVFSNANRRLIEDLTELIRGLGGTVTLGEQWTRYDKMSPYKKSYRLSCRINFLPVRMTRKANKWKGSIKTKSAITSIKFAQRGLGRCLHIAAKDGLYITDNYLLTHNSIICSVIYPLHQALFKEKQDICIISASESLSIEWLRKIRRELESNRMILAYFGDLKSSKWTENHLILKSGINIRARGAEGQIRGFRPDCVILDDIETDESVASEDRRKKLRNWLLKACINTLTPDGQLIWMGTIIDFLALLEEFLGKDINWVKKRYAGYIDGIEEEGHELWPALWPHNRLQDKKKEIGSWAFSAEIMNNPISDETAPIKPEQIRYYDTLPDKWSCVIIVDPAYKDDETADYKVSSVIAMDPNQNRYLVSYIRTHNPSGEFMDGILNQYLQFKNQLTSLGVPGGVEGQFYKNLAEKAERRKLYPPFVIIKNVFAGKRDKTSRIVAALQPLFEAGKYYIHKAHIEAKEELLTIGKSRWDDIVDSMAGAEQVLQSVYYQMPEEEKETSEYQLHKTAIADYGYEI